MRRGLAPLLEGRRIAGLVIRERRLRWPIPPGLEDWVQRQRIAAVDRRAKYLLIGLECGTLLLHLGMSGSLRVLSAGLPPGKHDHLDLLLGEGQLLRLRDPRRFAALLWTREDPLGHPLLRDLGPEPLGAGFDGDYLYQASRGRRLAVKQLIMDGRVVVGVGNIYASEALFSARIHPLASAGSLDRQACARLVAAIRRVLGEALEAGGTSLRDFVREDGRPGYFAQALRVYGRDAQPCLSCGAAIERGRIGQRSTFFCPRCQVREDV